MATEPAGDRVTLQVVHVDDRSSGTVLLARCDSDYDKTGLSNNLILTGHLVIRHDLITGLFSTFNRT